MTLLRELSVAFGLGVSDLQQIIDSAPARYKVYKIAKRRGGTRTIAQPSREVKALQRYLLENFLNRFPVHEAAKGYVKKQNIRDNAQAHVDNRVLLKLDFTSFFPSLLLRDWRRVVRARIPGLAAADRAQLEKILFWGAGSRIPKCLSIGAPTSPALSNIIMFDIDSQLKEAADKAGVNYTRYADDITASGPSVEALLHFEAVARRIVHRSKSPTLVFNEGKRGLYAKGQRRMVTGLIITPEAQISIGRERKRLISAMLHKATLGNLDEEGMGQLKGLIGFAVANEADFIGRMRKKYGSAVVDAILRFRVLPRKRKV